MEGGDRVDAHADFQVGQRVHSLNFEKRPQVGTVKYVGAVDGHEGVWIGVDWDSGHGRHNGTVNGRAYFETHDGAASGSLVRPQSLSAGVSLIEAILCRYNSSVSRNGPEQDDMYVLSVRQRRMPVELVGKSQIEARQKQLQHLRIASLAYSGVSSVGSSSEIQTLTPNLKDLDLTGNLLPDWLAVENLCVELPSLEVLNLSCSRLRVGPDRALQTQLKIRTLVLNYCHITWKQVEELKAGLNLIEELHLCGNRISKIEGDPSFPAAFVEGFDSLRLLNLEDNDLNNWEDILKLSKLKRLEHLNLNSNSIHEVFYPGRLGASEYGEDQVKDKDISATAPFGSLLCLLLGKNRITSWTSIDALNKFPRLQDLRLSENPIATTTVGIAPRYMIVARIHRITTLNGSEIKPRERRDAEIRYVRHVLGAVPGESVEGLEKLHPRLKQLRISHDVPLESTTVGAALTSRKMSASLLPISFNCVASSVGEKPPVTKKLPASTTVGKLKQICEGLFKLRAAQQRIFLKDQDPLPVRLDNELETLDDLGVGAGAVILVDDNDGP